jgi:hypothetical protein
MPRVVAPEFWAHCVRVRIPYLRRHYQSWRLGTGLPGRDYRAAVLEDLRKYRKYVDWQVDPPHPAIDGLKALIRQTLAMAQYPANVEAGALDIAALNELDRQLRLHFP